MAVTPSGWLSNSLVAVATLLANSASFRTLMGAADVNAALARIIYQDQRGATSAPFTVVRHLPGQLLAAALRTPAWTNTVDCELIWSEITTGATTQNELSLNQTNTFGAVLAEIFALINTGTYVAKADLDFDPPQRVADDHPFAGCWAAGITLNWET